MAKPRAKKAFIILGVVAAAVVGAYLLYGWWTRGARGPASILNSTA